jgi:putative Mn2+ efflux pump MntP
VFLRDLLVASVAFGLGLSMIQVALMNRGWCFDNFIIRRIEASRGRDAARKSLWIGGTAIILLGAWTLFAPLLKKGKSDSTTRGSYLAKTLQNGSC